MSGDYPADWDTRRKHVYERDDHKCQNCGRHGPRNNLELHAHHIVPKSKGGTHLTSNLVTLCEQCHKSIHSNKYAPTIEHVRENSPMGIKSELPNRQKTKEIIEEYDELRNDWLDFFGDLAPYVREGNFGQSGLSEELERRKEDFSTRFGRVKFKFNRNPELFNELGSNFPELVEQHANIAIGIIQIIDEIVEHTRENDLSNEEAKSMFNTQLSSIIRKHKKAMDEVNKEANALERKIIQR